MALYYIPIMKNALEKFHKEQLPENYNKYLKHLNPKLQDDFYTMLAWRGIKETNKEDYNKLSQQKLKDLETAEKIILRFMGNECR